MLLKEFKMHIFIVCIKNGLNKKRFNKLINIFLLRMRLIL